VQPVTLVDVLTLTWAAERIGVHVTTLQRAIQRGELDAQRVGHQLFVRPADVDRWAAARRQP
jgi:excisionase family DNA binding protein